MPHNTFADTAWLYDLDREARGSDYLFYRRWAERTGSPVLELACGTGRLTLPLAADGFEVRGLDLSPSMLQVLHGKAENLAPGARGRLQVVEGDMSDFSLPETFSLIFIPDRSFQGLIHSQQQEGCLRCAKRHLRPGGYFIIDVFKPYAQLDQSWVAETAVDWEIVDPETCRLFRRSHNRRFIDSQRQIIYPELHYEVWRDGRWCLVGEEKLQLSYFYEEQLRELLQRHGFVVEEEWGNYDGTPMGCGPELIFVCRYNGEDH